MKKYIKGLLVIFLFFLSINIVKAVEPATCDDYVNEDSKTACKNVRDYCLNNKGGDKGCIYNPNDSNYNGIWGATNSNGTRGTFVADYAKLTRGYTGVDKNGNVVFAGCYKYENKREQGGLLWNFYAYKWPKRTYFVFKFKIPDKNGNCKETVYDIVPSASFGNFDGHNAIGTDSATYKWIAQQGGPCPRLFALTGNPIGSTANKNKFVFADNQEELASFDKVQFRLDFWNVEHYELTVGCTVEDEQGFNLAIKCYDDAITELNSITCPENLSDTTPFSEKINGLGRRCDNWFRVAYKDEYLNTNSNTFKTKLKNAVNNKLTSCQYSKCKLTDTEISKLSTALSGTVCEKGCSGFDSSDNGRRGYGNCIGCIQTALNKINLSKEKKECIMNLQEEKDNAVGAVNGDIDADQDQDIQAEHQEYEEIAEYLADHYRDPLGLLDMPDIPIGEIKECNDIIGPNLSKVIKASITILQIVGAIIAIVKGMMTLIPPILAKDADALKKAGQTLTKMAIILIIIFIFKPLIMFLGEILKFDTSCIV